MRGVYTSAAAVPSITSAGTLAYITPPSGKVVEVLAITVTNESNATNYQMEVQLCPIATLGTPTGYTAVTPQHHEAGDQAAGSTVNIASGNSRTEPTTYGTPVSQEGAASVIGYRHEPQPEERIYLSGATGAGLGVRLITAPGASTTFDVRVTFREIG
jgi:hypothetical protein